MPAPIQNLKITFNDIPKKGDILALSFWGDHPTDSVEFFRAETFEDARVVPYQTTVGTSINDQATLYGNAFELDYGSNFEIVVVDNVVYLRTTTGSDIFNYSFNGNEGTVTFGDEEPPVPEITILNAVVRSPYLALSQDSNTFDTTTFTVKVFNSDVANYVDIPVLFSKTKKKVQRGQSIIYTNISYLVKEGFSADIDYYVNNRYTIGVLPIKESEGKWCAVEMTNKLFDIVRHTQTQLIYITDGYLNNEEDQVSSLKLLDKYGSSKTISYGSPERYYFKTKNIEYVSYFLSNDENEYIVFSQGAPFLNPDLSQEYIGSLGVVYNTYDSDIFEAKWIKYVAHYLDPITSEISTMSKKYYLVQGCQDSIWNLIFKDKTGFLQTLPLTKKAVKTLTVTSEDCSRNIVDINGSYNPNRHTTKQFNTNGGEQWTLNTDFIPEFNNDVIRQAMLSEEMWIQSELTGELHPVTRMDDTVTFKTQFNDKLINYTLKVKLSHKTIKSFK